MRVLAPVLYCEQAALEMEDVPCVGKSCLAFPLSVLDSIRTAKSPGAQFLAIVQVLQTDGAFRLVAVTIVWPVQSHFMVAVGFRKAITGLELRN